jgi:hypothetical protein
MKIQKPISIEKRLSKVMFWIVALPLTLSIFYSNSLAFRFDYFAFTANPTSGPAPLEVLFTCKAECSVPIAKYRWDFGDGNIVEITTNNTTCTYTHTYQNAGIYKATVTVMGNRGNLIKTFVPKEIIVGLSDLPGDCDDDGQVTIGELQKCINCFLGIENACCDECDGNSDGEVSIDELQKVINASLGLY